MKRHLIILSALCLILPHLSSCGKKEEPSDQDPPSKEKSAGGSPKSSIPSKETPSSPSGVQPAPVEDPAPVDPETPEDPTSNEPDAPDDAPAPAEPTGKTAPPAVVAFKAELKEKGIWKLRQKIKDLREGRGGGRDPFAMFDALRNLSDLDERLSAVNTEGLPADLKEPAEHFRDATADMTTHLEEMPIPLDILTAGPEVMQEWFAEKAVEDPGFMLSMRDWGQTMGELGGEIEEADTSLDNALSIYGIDPSAE